MIIMTVKYSITCLVQIAHFKRERWLIKGNKYLRIRIWSFQTCQRLPLMGLDHFMSISTQPPKPLVAEKENTIANTILRELLQSR